MGMKHGAGALCAMGVFLMGTPIAHAQESALVDAATQPAKGRVTWREQARFERFDLGGERVDQWTIDTRLTLGLSKDWSVALNVPTIDRDRSAPGADDRFGLGDVTLTLKHRFWQHDPGPIDTNRLAVVGGLRLPTGTDGLSSGGYDPFVGLTFTRVSGRHGVNASARYLFTTSGEGATGASPVVEAGQSGADLFTFESSYLYRLSPGEYTSETESSLYFSVESILDWDTDGDIDWRVAPGLLYEARRFTVELSPIVPVARDVDRRAERQWGVAFGLRVLF